jgi:carnitine O-acetyltransferase
MAGWAPGTVKRIITGDYSLDVELEHGTQGDAFYVNQATLPHLPVPELNETLDTYLKTVEALATPAEFEHTKTVVQAFRTGMGEVLHKRLLEHAQNWQHSSWFQKWWNQMGYLQWKARNVINLNYFFFFAEDIGLPVPTWHPKAEEMNLQSLVAARMATGILAFRDRLIAGTEPPEMSGKSPICLSQWKYLFNNCRVPAPNQDEFHLYNPTLPASNTILVIRKNKFFIVAINDAAGKRLSSADLAAQFTRIIAEAGTESDLNVGVLTSNDRDNWMAARNQLLADGNEGSLEAIQQAAFTVCLDDSAPVSREEVSRKLWHGEQSAKTNRWFDKTISIIAFRNGKAGCNVEHCMFDGSPTRHLMCTVLEQLRAGKVDHGSAVAAADLAAPVPIKFIITATTARMIQKAGESLDQWTGIHDLKVLAFQGYGSDAIKKMKCSPDAFAQMAMQYAYYKNFGRQAATYESSSTRGFLHGRTETTRSASVESGVWIAAMQNPKATEKERHELFIKAVNAHSDYLKRAAAGKGIDRILWGLKLCMKPGESEPMFQDPLYSRASTWIISTSHLVHELVDGWGFGEVDAEGVGIGYSVKAAMMQFNVTCQHKERNWSANLCQYIDEALLELRALCAAAEKGFA